MKRHRVGVELVITTGKKHYVLVLADNISEAEKMAKAFVEEEFSASKVVVRNVVQYDGILEKVY